jgi:hypothetical protein
MGTGNVSTSEKRGLTSDHILSRLQGELQKSCEMGVELHNLTGGSERYSRYSQQLISEHFLLSSLIYIKLLPQHANLPPCPCALPPFDLLPPKIPRISPTFHIPPLHPLSQSSKPNSTTSSPPSRPMLTNCVRSGESSLSTTLSSVRSVYSDESERVEEECEGQMAKQEEE